MQLRTQHTQRLAAAKAGISERTARRIERDPRPPSQKLAAMRRRNAPDPLDGLWESDILPLLESRPGLRPIALLEEMQRRIITSGPSTVERLVAAALVLAERHVAGQLTRGLSPAQTEALDALLTLKQGAVVSGLAWARQPPGAPGYKALKRVIEQLAALRAVGLDPACAEAFIPSGCANSRGRAAVSPRNTCAPCRRSGATRPSPPPCWTPRRV